MSRPRRGLQRAQFASFPFILRRILPRGRILHSTRIAPTRVRSSHAGSEESSPSGRSATRIIATNGSPSDWYRYRLLLTYGYSVASTSRLRIFASEIRRTRSGAGGLWFRSQLVSLRRLKPIAILADAQITGPMEFLVGTGYPKTRNARRVSPRWNLNKRSSIARFPIGGSQG